eukprot:TRINITY_DN40578_c0_g1_i1.p1 TRINITY_DN40578_c0_g1~~TRINITY_DN40578_c0_g1_i1.p1  ORF type:complete len:291 (+),score=54.14 TRINITY_DN40578_c0_g1_i1:31-873(+)
MADSALADPRRAVETEGRFSRKVSAEELRAPLPSASGQTSSSPAGACRRNAAPAVARRLTASEACVLLGRQWSSKLAQAVTQICGTKLAVAAEEVKDPTPSPPPRRWYRVHPITNTTYFVRPDAGLRGRIPGYTCVEEQASCEARARQMTDPQLQLKGGAIAESLPVRSTRHVKRRPSLPPEVERRCGLGQESVDSLLDITCKICYDQSSDVVVLPCKHGGMCAQCLRRHMFMKPMHRGGGRCPHCRRPIQEVIQLYREAVLPHSYGYAIKASCFAKFGE